MLGSRLSHYEIVEKLGEGGMGVVYKARDHRLGRFVALKVLAPKTVSDPERRMRLVQEARAASALNHPNIITVHDIDTEGDITFIAMEYVDGRTLDHRIGSKGLRLSEALGYAVQVSDALAVAHGAGIVHRDIKPSNVMVTDKGLVKVLDFGLAKIAGEPVDQGSDGETVSIRNPLLTEQGTVVGTVAYMSPEQAEGKKVDARSDIFSFGVMFYEMLTGRRPFTGDTNMSTLAAILNQDPKPAHEIVEQLPREVERTLTQCLRKDPSRRLQHMDDLKVLLEDLRQESESGKFAPAPSAAPRSMPRYLVSGAVALAVLTAVAVWLWTRRAPVPPTPAALAVVPLTTYAGNESHPSFSPDGRQIAFSWNGEKRDNLDIYVRFVDGGTPLRLTTDARAEFAPTWSPDGRWIAFARAATSTRSPSYRVSEGIYLISPLGGPERKLADVATSFLAWMPDSQSLAFEESRTGTERGGIFSISITTGEKWRLTSLPPGYFGDRFFAFSPDGQYLVFARFPSTNTSDVYLMKLSGGEPQRILQHTAVGGIAWTAGSQELVYSTPTQASLSFWRLRVASTEAPQPLPALGIGTYPAISRPGPGVPSRLAFQRGTGDSNIYRIQDGVAAPLIASTHPDLSPEFSSDGTRIAFASSRSGRPEIWVSDSSGANPVQLTSLPAANSHSCRWSPDGRSIAFSSITQGNRDVFVIPSAGGAPRHITSEASEEGRPSWSRDGRWIYFYSVRTGQHQIWKAPAEGGPAVQITKGGGHEAFESPDGQTLYFTKPDSLGLTGLWSMPAAGGEEKQVVEGVSSGLWSIADQGIYFIDIGATRSAPIKFFDFGTGRIRETGTVVNQPVLRSSPGFAVSRDGRSILIALMDQLGSDLMLVENFH